MAATFIRRSQASMHLQGHWCQAILVQGSCLCAEILLIAGESICFYRFGYISIFSIFLLADLLLLSPLKAGRAFFYQTVVTDGGKASYAQLFRFYHDGYRKSINWRLELWIRRMPLYLLLCVPSAFFLYFSRSAWQTGSDTVAMVAFVFFLFFLMVALITVEILLFRYIPAVHLLTENVSAKHALLLSKRLSKGYTGKWALLYLDYAGWCLSLLLLFPFFYVSPLFHTARAATANGLFSDIPSRIGEQLLQHRENHDRIRKEF